MNKFITDSKRLSFYNLVSYSLNKINSQSELSAKNFSENQISFPEKFIGMSIMGTTCTEHNLNYVLKAIRKESQHLKNPYFIEYMCHPVRY